MSATIQFDPGRGEVRVGGTPFGCSADADGALVVDGYPVRAVTLGERDRLVALTTGDEHRARDIARLIADAATQTGNDGPIGELRAALEAVALHLAGAERSGALARTTLLVARATGLFGDAVTTVPAHEADRLADMLDASLPAAGNDVSPPDEGWTTISYDPVNTGPVPAGPVAARNRLAELLLRRDRPVSNELAALLLGVAPSAGPAAEGDERVDRSFAQLSMTIDRCADQPSQIPFPTGSVDRWAPSNTAAVHAPVPDSAHHVGGCVIPLTTPVGTDVSVADVARLDPGASAIASRWNQAPSPYPSPSPSPSPPQADSLAGAGLPDATTFPHAPAAAAGADPGRWPGRRVGASPEPQLAARSAVAADPLDGVAGAARLTTRFHRPELPRRDPEPALDLDAVALALHRAADLRGIA